LCHRTIALRYNNLCILIFRALLAYRLSKPSPVITMPKGTLIQRQSHSMLGYPSLNDMEEADKYIYDHLFKKTLDVWD